MFGLTINLSRLGHINYFLCNLSQGKWSVSAIFGEDVYPIINIHAEFSGQECRGYGPKLTCELRKLDAYFGRRKKRWAR